MRVIAGIYKSRKLESLPGLETRPTPDRMRESLFSILMPVIEGASFVDACAGTGAVGIEAISRGAADVTFIEKDKRAADVIRHNLSSLKAPGRVIRGLASLHLTERSDAIVFVDPPYDQPRVYADVFGVLEDNPPRMLIVQHSVRFATPEVCGPLRRTRLLKQGDNALSFYSGQSGSVQVEGGFAVTE